MDFQDFLDDLIYSSAREFKMNKERMKYIINLDRGSIRDIKNSQDVSSVTREMQFRSFFKGREDK